MASRALCLEGQSSKDPDQSTGSGSDQSTAQEDSDPPRHITFLNNTKVKYELKQSKSLRETYKHVKTKT